MFTFSAIVFFVVYYPFALPTAIVLMYATRLGLLGYWLPFTLANFIQCVPFFVYIACIDWRRVIEQQTAAKHPARTSQTAARDEAVESSLDSGLSASLATASSFDERSVRADDSTTATSGSGNAHRKCTETTRLLQTSRSSNPFPESDPSEKSAAQMPQFSGTCELSVETAGHLGAERVPIRTLLAIAGVAILIAGVDCVAVLLRFIRPEILTLSDHEANIHGDVTSGLFNATTMSSTIMAL